MRQYGQVQQVPRFQFVLSDALIDCVNARRDAAANSLAQLRRLVSVPSFFPSGVAQVSSASFMKCVRIVFDSRTHGIPFGYFFSGKVRGPSLPVYPSKRAVEVGGGHVG